MENQDKPHKRRVRYSGTHPKSFKEKYKEHNPEKYADTIAKVIQKGSEEATGNYFNQDVNTVSAMDSALSYASRLVAEDIVFNLTNP